MKIIPFLLICLLVSAPIWAIESNSVIILSATNISEVHEAIQLIESKGGIIDHVFPMQVLIGYISPELDQSLISQKHIVEIKRTAASPEIVKDANSRDGLRAWNIFSKLAKEEKIPTVTGIPKPLTGCMKRPGTKATNFCYPLNLSIKYTSQYMIGNVSASIILVESNGSSEDWTTAEEDKAIAEIMEGHSKLSQVARQQNVMVRWFYEVHRKVPTSFEPIEGRSVPYCINDPLPNNLFEWIEHSLNFLGYSGDFQGAWDYANDSRRAHKTEWGYSVFVVMDKNHPPYKFSDGIFAYVAPVDNKACFLVMTYHNDGWGVENMDLVLAHETSHIFGALDEYAESDCNCTEVCGYLQVSNGNCVNCNSAAAPCLCVATQYTLEIMLCVALPKVR